MESATQNAPREPGQDSLRLSGRFYSIDQLIEGACNHVASPSNLERNLASLLYIILFVAISMSGYSLGGFETLLISLLIHEAGHWLGMILVGWSKVKFGLGLLGPVSWADEDISAGRKMAVALAGPAVGLIGAMIANLVGASAGSGFLLDLSHALYFITLLNLLPIKPFDGYTVMEHLIFVRHPRLEMFHLAASGVALFLFSIRLFGTVQSEPVHFPFFVLFFMMFSFSMFYGVKKRDNMADMVVRLRRNGKSDYEAGRYSPGTIKRMEYSLEMFDFPNDTLISAFLRELWDDAWEQPPTLIESVFTVAMYTTLVAAFLVSAAAISVAVGILSALGV